MGHSSAPTFGNLSKVRSKAEGECLRQRTLKQGHLRKQGVGSGDLFLFFGIFQRIEQVRRRWQFAAIARTVTCPWPPNC